MNELISLAIYVGRLEARLEALEKRPDVEEAPHVRLGLGHTEPSPDEAADRDAQQAAKLLQEGIDNIMNYQGPGGKGGSHA